MVQIKMTGPEDMALFDHVHDDVFDGPIQPDLLRSHLADPRLHMGVVLDASVGVIGMVTGVHYHHPDKPAQMWINELGVATEFRRRGLATRLIAALSDAARRHACTEIWVIADPTDMAEGFYASLGWARSGTRLAMFTGQL